MTTFPFALDKAKIDRNLWDKVQSINLDLIIDRMIIKHSWTEEKTSKAVKDYRHFLYISQLGEQAITPTGDVDDIWHEHILHTNKYAIDCEKSFGKFLHHFPIPAKWPTNQPTSSFEVECTGTTNCATTECTSDCSPRLPDYDNPIVLQNKECLRLAELKIRYNLS